ncbi:hypothetical protein GCM10027203_55830 [Nonomuraea fastidiosa]
MKGIVRLLAAAVLTGTGLLVVAPATNAAVDPAAVLECVRSNLGEITAVVDPSYQGFPVQLPLVRCAAP